VYICVLLLLSVCPWPQTVSFAYGMRLFVLKVPLNTNRPTNRMCVWTSCNFAKCSQLVYHLSCLCISSLRKTRIIGCRGSHCNWPSRSALALCCCLFIYSSYCLLIIENTIRYNLMWMCKSWVQCRTGLIAYLQPKKISFLCSEMLQWYVSNLRHCCIIKIHLNFVVMFVIDLFESNQCSSQFQLSVVNLTSVTIEQSESMRNKNFYYVLLINLCLFSCVLDWNYYAVNTY